MGDKTTQPPKPRAGSRKTTTEFKLKMSKGFDSASKLMEKNRLDDEIQNQKE